MAARLSAERRPVALRNCLAAVAPLATCIFAVAGRLAVEEAGVTTEFVE